MREPCHVHCNPRYVPNQAGGGSTPEALKAIGSHNLLCDAYNGGLLGNTVWCENVIYFSNEIFYLERRESCF